MTVDNQEISHEEQASNNVEHDSQHSNGLNDHCDNTSASNKQDNENIMSKKSNKATNGISQESTTNGVDKCNLTLVLKEPLNMILEQRPLPPKPAPNEVTLATHTVGICGSDVKYWQTGKIGHFVMKKELILGHETSAIVTDVGSKIKNLKVGDKVAVEVGLPCNTCAKCRTGRYNLCSDMAFAATPPFDGTLTRYFNHPADFCFKLPESVGLEEGALLEPLSVAVHACQRATIKLGDVVLVCGAGAIGLVTMLSAKAFGASYVIMTDVNESRLQFAKKMGANATICIQKGQTVDELAELVRQTAEELKPGGSDGVDIVLECSGAESSFNLALQATCLGGQIILVGCQPDTVTIQISAAILKEIDIKTVFRYKNCYPIALALVESGRIDLKPLISHRFALEQAVEAFEVCAKGQCVKVLVNCMESDRNK